jgi:hypothetical protein
VKFSAATRRSNLTICLITDEVSPSVDEGLAFVRDERGCSFKGA